MLLTNKPNSVQKAGVCETGLNDCHKIVFTIFPSTFLDFSQKLLNIETVKVLMKTFFCHELYHTLLKHETYKSEEL